MSSNGAGSNDRGRWQPITPGNDPSGQPPAAPSNARADAQNPYTAYFSGSQTPYDGAYAPNESQGRRGLLASRSRSTRVVASMLTFLVITLIAAGTAIISANRGLIHNNSGADTTGAREAVQTYLNALADGDAKAALAVAEAPEENATFLTEDVLRESLRRAPITDISVGEATAPASYARVPVSYRVGTTDVETRFTVEKTGSTWKVKDAFISDRGPSGTVDVDFRVNGSEPVSGDLTEYDFFPGSYEFAPASANFIFDGDATVMWADPTAVHARSVPVDVELSDEGRSAANAALQAAVDECLRSKTLRAGCGLSLRADASTHPIVDGTVTRSLPAETAAKVSDAAGSGAAWLSGAVLNTGFFGATDATADCTRDGTTSPCTLVQAPMLAAAEIDLAAEPITVKWN